MSVPDSDGTPSMEGSSTDMLDLRVEKTNAVDMAKPPGYNGFTWPSSAPTRNGCYGIEKPLYPAPHILMDTSETSEGNACLDLSKDGPNAVPAITRLHCSGGSSFDLTKLSGYAPDGYMGLSGHTPYFQMPRIKLQPGLGIGMLYLYH